jgi:hypothetical protein
MYPWPIGNFDYAMDDALDIALHYLDRTGQAARFQEVQSTAAKAIVAAWKTGVRHRIKLAENAIKAVEQGAAPFLDLTIEYRGFKYAVVKGVERGVWRWSVSLNGVSIRGEQPTRSAAVTAAQKAIDRAALKLADERPDEPKRNREDLMNWSDTFGAPPSLA